MGTLNYAATVSLDGYAADRAGGIAWAAPDAEVFAFHLQRMREVTTEILGRRTYSMMQYWEDPP
ncbi:MAG TPA: deaminase, partial [Yaniella sp.]